MTQDTSRRHFGSVRKLPSGRYQASYWHEGERHVARDTFPAKAHALAWLSETETAIRHGGWVDPAAGRQRFNDYALGWLADRHDLRLRTRELYVSELNRHLLPAFGALNLVEITTGKVRTWHAGIAKETPVTAAKCYRLLRTILGTAVEDGRLVTNPCTIKRAGQEHSPERRIPTLEQVDALASALPERYRALVYTAAYATLRFGECSALTRECVDLVHRTIAVRVRAQRVVGVGLVIMDPKSEAGRRVVAIPRVLAASLEEHLACFVAPEPAALVFTGDKGGPLERGNFSARFATARDAAGLDKELHFHDLRHFAGTTAAQTGATTREIMARLGHSTPRAALIYQHATEERDHAIAAGIDALISGSEAAPIAPVVRLSAEGGAGRSRTQRARPRKPSAR